MTTQTLAPAPPQRVDADEALLAFMQQRDVACPLCKYNLRDLASPTCPECGSKLMLSVQQAEPYTRAWLTTVIALSLPTGFFIVWTMLIIKEWSHVSQPDWSQISVPVLYLLFTVVSAPVLFATTIAFRRWFMRRSRSFQGWMSVAAVTHDMVALFCLMYEIN